MADPFDFGITGTGEITMNPFGLIRPVSGEDLRLQMAFNRIKSVSNNWYIDKIGADLEALVGRKCDEQIAEEGKMRIKNELVRDGLYDDDEIVIIANISDNVYVNYDIYLKSYQGESEETIITNKIQASLDLVRGVRVRYGWEPKR